MELSRQEYWSGQPFPSSGYLPNSGIKLSSPVLQADSLLSETPGKLILLFKTTLMAESEEELKSFLMKVKDESEKAGLKQHSKTKIMVPSLHGK